MDLENISLSELRQIIIALDPYIIGITSLTCNHISAINMARTVKSSKQDAMVIYGGVHATSMHKEILETVPEVDIVVRYEGEYTMCDIIMS